MPPIKFGLNSHFGLIVMSFEEFQDSYLGCRNGSNLAVLNLHGSPMPPTKFQLNPNYPSEQMLFQDFQAGHHGSHLRFCLC